MNVEIEVEAQNFDPNRNVEACNIIIIGIFGTLWSKAHIFCVDNKITAMRQI